VAKKPRIAIDKRVLDTDKALTDEIIAQFNTNKAEEEAIKALFGKRNLNPDYCLDY
jgi:hypothetical protein